MEKNSSKNQEIPLRSPRTGKPRLKKLKAKYSSLTDADLKFVAGKENELLNRIGVRLNKKT